MYQEAITTAVGLLDSIATPISTIANNLEANRLDRISFQKYLWDYADRAALDGELIDAARQNFRCANRALFLAQAHMELICWLADNNYTISSTSVKWYSWKKILGKYRLPLLGISSHTSRLKNHLREIKKAADQLYTDLEDNMIAIVPDSKYRKVRGPPVEYPPEEIEDIIHQGSLAHEKLSE